MFDIGEHEGERFLTMEFVEGQMLSAQIGAGKTGVGRPLPAALLLPIVKQICAGLSAAHAVGVIHRDLKPDKVPPSVNLSDHSRCRGRGRGKNSRPPPYAKGYNAVWMCVETP